jgi:hypothetical protein
VTLIKTSVVPLPEGTVALSSEQAAEAGQPVTVKATGLGNVPMEGVTVMSYFPDDPEEIVAGPELFIEKLNTPACTVKATTVFAVSDPDVPVTVIE